MKKVIVAAAAVAIAAATQANVVDWAYVIKGDKTVSSVATAQASAYANNFTAYLFAADAVADWTKLTSADLALARDSADIQYQTWSSRGGATYSTADQGGTVGAARSVDVGSAANYSAMFVVYDNVNNTYAYQSMSITSRDETAGAGTAGFNEVTQASFAALTFRAISGGASEIPEPTSGLLLLVGGAMLALRRRRS